MIAFGVLLVLLGLGSLGLLLALAAGSAGGAGSGEIVWRVDGLHLGLPAGPAILLTGFLGFAAALLVVGGVVLIHRARVRARPSDPDEQDLLETSVTARARLLEYRLQVLGQEIEALEARRSELGGGANAESIGLGAAATELSLLRGQPVRGWLAVPIPGPDEAIPTTAAPEDAETTEAVRLARRRGLVVVDDPKADEDETEGVVLVPETGDVGPPARPPRRRAKSGSGTAS